MTPSNSGDKRKIKNEYHENEIATQNKTIQQEPNKIDKYLGCPPRKILRTILELVEGRI